MDWRTGLGTFTADFWSRKNVADYLDIEHWILRFERNKISECLTQREQEDFINRVSGHLCSESLHLSTRISKTLQKDVSRNICNRRNLKFS